MAKIVSNYSWYYVQSQKLLCIGPSGYGRDGDWWELEEANSYLERGHGIVTATWTIHAMQHHAQQIKQKWHIPPEARFASEVPYNPTTSK